MEGSMQKLGGKIKRTLAGNWWVEVAVAVVAVREDLGWRKLEERREEKKLLFGWSLQRMSEDRLVMKVVALLNNC